MDENIDLPGQLELIDSYLEDYTSACKAFSTYPLEILELYPDFVDKDLCAEDEEWNAERHFGVSDTKMFGVEKFFQSFAGVQAKKIILRHPHCFVLGYLEKCFQEGLKDLEEISIIGCLDVEFEGIDEKKSYVKELEKILKARKNLKYSITCGDVWDERYPTRVIEGHSSSKK